MGVNVVCLAAVLLGIDARWPPLPGGGVRYVVQIEPHLLDRLRSGAVEAVRSDVPPYVNDVRAYQIAVGTQRLPRHAPAADVSLPIQSGVDTDWVALPAGGRECRVWIESEVLAEFGKPGRAIQGQVPAGAGKVMAFSVTVGRKPPAAGSHAAHGAKTDRDGPAGSDWPNVEKVPAGGPTSSLPATPPLRPVRSNFRPPLSPPGMGPRPSHRPEMPEASQPRTVPDPVPSPPPFRSPVADPSSEPPVFEPRPDSKPMPAVHPAGHSQQSTTQRSETRPSKTTSDPRPQADPRSPINKGSSQTVQGPEKPWPLLLVTLLGLFASLGGNVFLLWILRDSRRRYRELLK